ncbi:MAG: SPOR domain-containing protein [Hyphomicrobiaceae bacterium]|nr:SPOR domain-containing protein [Hyphomicrobiaceae bacterium]MCC0010596.1 SPOR domain-containing protein [Hyphomicrobiaceae bacterium]
MARKTGPAHSAQRWPEPNQAPDGHHNPRPHPTQANPGYSRHLEPTPRGQSHAYAPGQEQHYQHAPNQQAPARQQAPYQPGQPAPLYPPDSHADYGDLHAQLDPFAMQQPGAPAYVPPQAAPHAPQFEPYYPPEPGQHDQQGWEQSNQWQTGNEAAAPGYDYQQQMPGNPDPVYSQSWGHADQNDGYDAYQPPHHAEPRLRGADYDPAFSQPGYDQGFGHPHDQQGGPAPGWGGQDYADAAYPGEPFDYGQAPRDGFADAPALADSGLAQGYAPEPGFGRPDSGTAGLPDQYEQYDDDYDADEMAYEDEEPRGRGRFIKIAAVLAIAIGVGSGLVYGYGLVFGPSNTGDTPVVRTAGAPSKIKPDEPGGKEFAHKDSKILGRLSDGGSQRGASVEEASSESSDNTDSNGTRKVSTMVIGRDGSIVSQPDTERPPPARLPDSVSPVPGMTIVDGFGGRSPRVSSEQRSSAASMINSGRAPAPPPAAAPQEVREPQPEASRQVSTPAKPIIISRTEPEAAREEPPPAPAAAPASKPQAAAPRKAPSSAPVAASTATSGLGYVAVLASIPVSATSRMNALTRFADLQQKYSSQLGGKTPEVQQANLGSRGSYHRLIAGPPGSRSQANHLCSELKAAGYPSCWIKSY